MSEKPSPIYSNRADDPAYTHLIDAFVVGVAERIDHLQDADSRGDLPLLRSLAERLHNDALAVGYDTLARTAAEVGAACAEDEGKLAHQGVVALTDLACRIRLGHRGAMS